MTTAKRTELQRTVAPLTEAGRKMDAALAKLRSPGTRESFHRSGRLIFGLDLTASREASLRDARIATAAMFDTVKSFGKIAIKLAYFRGTDECRSSNWHDDAEFLSQSMQRLGCEAGNTQIRRLLRLALNETEKLSCVVYIGDHCDEDAGALRELARQLGKKGVPLFMFHECEDHDRDSLSAKPIFKLMAEVSGGVYAEFKAGSGAALREMLLSLAVFTTTGRKGISHMSLPATVEGRKLHGQLLLSADNSLAK